MPSLKNEKYLLPIGIFVGAVLLSVLLLFTAPEAKKRPQGAVAPMVDVAGIEKGDFPVVIEAMGKVVAAQEIELIAQVSGEVITAAESFVPGGVVNAGELLLNIDPKDYELELARQQANYDIELGQQKKARKELEILRSSGSKGPKDKYLVLRGPQLKQAEVGLQKAQLDLERTKVSTPFNAMITETKVNLGTKVSTQQSLATLVGTDEYWVQLSVSIDQIPWVLTGEGSSPAQIRLNGGRGAIRYGKVARIVGQLEQSSRLAPVIISIEDPLQLNTQQEKLSPVLLGDYVSVSVFGKTLNNVYRAPHHFVRNGNIVWAARNEKMVFVPIEVLHKDREFVYFTADELIPDERIVTSEIATPINGMKIEIKINNADNLANSQHNVAQHASAATSHAQ